METSLSQSVFENNPNPAPIMSNKAAWLTAAKARPLQVDDAPMPTPEPHEVVIRVYAAALNPVDAGIQEMGIIIEKYPWILGCDAAGEVTAVGSAVGSAFKPGDRVLAYCDGADHQQPANGAFQLYCATNAKGVAKLPDHVSYTQGSVLPLAISTAATALFQKDAHALSHPQIDAKPTGEVVLVWGGGSSVGSCAIQLLKGAGFQVAATASGLNQDYCTGLGAKYVFDYAKDNVVDDIVEALKGKRFGGVFSAIIGEEVMAKCGQIASRLDGNRFVSTVYPPGMAIPDVIPSNVKTSVCKETWTLCPFSKYNS